MGRGDRASAARCPRRHDRRVDPQRCRPGRCPPVGRVGRPDPAPGVRARPDPDGHARPGQSLRAGQPGVLRVARDHAGPAGRANAGRLPRGRRLPRRPVRDRRAGLRPYRAAHRHPVVRPGRRRRGHRDDPAHRDPRVDRTSAGRAARAGGPRGPGVPRARRRAGPAAGRGVRAVRGVRGPRAGGSSRPAGPRPRASRVSPAGHCCWTACTSPSRAPSGRASSW